MIKERRDRKQIVELTTDGGAKLVEPAAVSEEIISFYKSLMGPAPVHTTAVNKNIMKTGPTLSHAQQLALCAKVTDEEIYGGLRSIGDDKAPGVDGYNAKIFKKAWQVIQSDVNKAVKDFFSTGTLYKPVNCTTVTLLPKVPNPTSVKQYRPIACCSAVYKLIAKVLANRIHLVVASVVSETQAGFIPGRKVADNIIIAHELVRSYSRKHISPRCMIKVDIQKAYDSVDWNFLEQVMSGLGFPTKFIGWVMQCLTTVTYSIMINGELTRPFKAARGSHIPFPLCNGNGVFK